MPRGVYVRTAKHRAAMSASMIGNQLHLGHTYTCSPETRATLSARMVRHGHSRPTRTPTYRSWEAMVQRCTNPNNRDWKYYGGRAIPVTICDRWHIPRGTGNENSDFANFFADMGERPKGLTLDRKDNDGPYAPGNCRWATPSEQRRNQRPRRSQS